MFFYYGHWTIKHPSFRCLTAQPSEQSRLKLRVSSCSVPSSDIADRVTRLHVVICAFQNACNVDLAWCMEKVEFFLAPSSQSTTCHCILPLFLHVHFVSENRLFFRSKELRNSWSRGATAGGDEEIVMKIIL